MSNTEQINPAPEHVKLKKERKKKVELADQYEEIGIRAVVAALQCGSGRLNLNSASARTGGTVTLSGGTMLLGDVAALGTSAIPLALSGGTLDLATDSSV